MMKVTLFLATLTCVPVLAVPVAMQPTKPTPKHTLDAATFSKKLDTLSTKLDSIGTKLDSIHTPGNREKGAVSLAKQDALYIPTCSSTSNSSKLIFPSGLAGSNKTTMLGGKWNGSPEAWCNYPKGWGNGAPSKETCATQIVWGDNGCMSSHNGQEATMSCATWASWYSASSGHMSAYFFAWDCAWNDELQKCKASSDIYKCPIAFADGSFGAFGGGLTTLP